jgi:hypothetical protein
LADGKHDLFHRTGSFLYLSICSLLFRGS